jgi:hypothetical protein
MICSTFSARADTEVYDTFGAGDDYNPSTGWAVGIFGLVQGAQFSPTSSGTLTGIDLALSHVSGPSHVVNLQLFADDGSNAPGALLDSFSTSTTADFGTCCSFLTVESTAGPFLTGGAFYWIIASGTSDSNNAWNFNSIDLMGPHYLNGSVMGNEMILPAFRVSVASAARLSPDLSEVPELNSSLLVSTVFAALFIGRSLQRRRARVSRR